MDVLNDNLADGDDGDSQEHACGIEELPAEEPAEETTQDKE